MIKFGAVNIDTSHPNSFAACLEKGERGRYTALYNDGFRTDEEVDTYMKKFGIEKRFGSIEEMIDAVDIGMVHSCNWDNHLKEAKPFIEKGKPVFIDKPIAGNISDLKELENLAGKGGIILGSSSARYCNEISGFLSMDKEERGEIVNIFGSGGVDEFNYAIHIVEGICGILGDRPSHVKFTGSGEAEGLLSETYFIRFNSGRSATYNTFSGKHQPFETVIMTTKNTFQFRVDNSKLYSALLDRICDYMEKGESSLAKMDELAQSVKIMLAGRISREKGGAEIDPYNIPDDDPGFDGSKFEKEYAEKARKKK